MQFLLLCFFLIRGRGTVARHCHWVATFAQMQYTHCMNVGPLTKLVARVRGHTSSKLPCILPCILPCTLPCILPCMCFFTSALAFVKRHITRLGSLVIWWTDAMSCLGAAERIDEPKLALARPEHGSAVEEQPYQVQPHVTAS
jgi:hypothetical protein